jgi:hypothetical protein
LNIQNLTTHATTIQPNQNHQQNQGGRLAVSFSLIIQDSNKKKRKK